MKKTVSQRCFNYRENFGISTYSQFGKYEVRREGLALLEAELFPLPGIA
jgi:hypothetical protein